MCLLATSNSSKKPQSENVLLFKRNPIKMQTVTDYIHLLLTDGC